MEEVMLEKAEFITKNKDKIISNITKVSYPLFKILASDAALEELEDYENVVKYLKNKETEVLIYPDYTKDERYILQTILSFIDRIATDYAEKEAARNSLSRYDRFFEKEKVKFKAQGA